MTSGSSIPARAVFIDFVGGQPEITAERYLSADAAGSDLGNILASTPLLLSSGGQQNAADAGEKAALEFSKSDIVVIGRQFDPFMRIDANLFSAMTFIEHLAGSAPAQLIVRTRSPYLILATPALAKLNRNSCRASVCFGLEAASAAHSKIVSRSTAVPAERLETMKSLRQSGIPTIAQFAPFFGAAQPIESIEMFCKLLSASVGEMQLVEFESLIDPTSCSLGERPERRFSAARPGRHSRSYVVAAEILAALGRTVAAPANADSGGSTIAA